jgi:primosomal protein N' (replication factor Y)
MSPARRGPGSRASGAGPEPAPALPVAQVVVDTPLPHLDRPFDYLVTAADHDRAQPGVRVRVRFAGRLTNGFLLARVTDSEHRPAPLTVVSPEVVLSHEVAGLARAVADRYAGSLTDVLRLAVPPRHARAELAGSATEPGAPVVPQPVAPGPDPLPFDPHALDPYGGAGYLAALAAGDAPRAVWGALPGPPWPAIAAAVGATVASGRGALVLVPDARDVARAAAALPRATVLMAGEGPAARYRRFLAVARGQARVVLGTRAAAFAPVAHLGLVVVWDDGDDLYAEPRAPYPHAREVALLRCLRQGTGLLLAGHAVTAEGASLLTSGWAHPLRATREAVRSAAPRVLAAGSDAEIARDEAAATARLPSVAWRTARQSLATGPVLIQVPRRGYVPGLACARCRTPARCEHCGGPLALPAARAAPSCRWCGRPAAAWHCPVCAHDRLRAGAVGERRTAEELGRAFPGVPVRTSGGDAVLSNVDGAPALVVATPGAEPVTPHGYAGVILLDAWALLGRPDLRAAEEALRRWLNAAALAAPQAPVVVVADAGLAVVQALVRWDPFGHADRELAERTTLGFPPAVRLAALDGPPAAVAGLLALAALPPSADVLGPVPAGAGERMLVRTPRADGAGLAAALHAAAAVRSARKETGPVRIQVDPAALG